MEKTTKKKLAFWSGVACILWFTGSIEGLVMCVWDLGWFVVAAFGLPMLVTGLIQGYAPWHIGELNRVSREASLLLWLTLLMLYDFHPSWQKWLMIISVLCWITNVIIVLCALYLVFRDEKKGIDVFP